MRVCIGVVMFVVCLCVHVSKGVCGGKLLVRGCSVRW